MAYEENHTLNPKLQNEFLRGMFIIRVRIKLHALSYKHSLADDFFSI